MEQPTRNGAITNMHQERSTQKPPSWEVCWKTNVANWREPKTVPWLTLPSNGCWGDIGYVTMRVAAGKRHGRKTARAEFVQKDFFLGNPVAPEKRNPVWDARLEDVKGAKCTFVI